jgi:hypothetical protein
MQTPAAINRINPGIINLQTFPKSWRVKFINKTYFHSKPQAGRLKDRGYILVNNLKTPILKSKLLKIIATRKKQALLAIKNWEEKDFKDFQNLVNGIFQAEGYAGGSFPYISEPRFRPKLCLGQNASMASIEFFCLLWVVLGKKLKFSINKTSENIYHITLLTSTWDTILELIPYFCYVYGYKYRSFLMLKDIHSLLKNGNLTNETITKIIFLGYNLVELSKKKISLNEKLLAVLNSNEKLDSKKLNTFLNNYTKNNKPLSMLFILGIILGDGNFLIRIRDTGKGLWFIPMFRIYQKNVLLNKELLDNIAKFLKGLGVNSHIALNKEKGRLLCLNIEGVTPVKAFYFLLYEHSKWFFWKKIQFSPLDKYLLLTNVASRHWKTGQLALLREIYLSNAFPKRKNNFEFYKKKLEIYFKDRLVSFQSPKLTHSPIPSEGEGLTKEDFFYICMSKDQSWLVTLPVRLMIKPKQKYFFFKTYGGNKEKALRAAIEYRDNSLNNWLINNGFKVK